MQNWQKDRNYRKYTEEDGSERYIITIDGENLEVTPEVFRAYSQEDRHERHIYERDEGKLLSLDRMNEDGVQLPFLFERQVESAEDSAIQYKVSGTWVLYQKYADWHGLG